MKEPKISERALEKFLAAYRQVTSGASEQDDESE